MSDNNKVIQAKDHIPALKEQRRKKSNRRLIMYLSIFFILILLVVYFQSPLSHVREIEVQGSEFVDEDTIIHTSGLKKGTSLWQMNVKKAESNVEELEEINEVSVNRSLPSDVKIHVVEHKRISYVEMNERYVPVLQNGTILENKATRQLPTDAPVIKGFKEGKQLEAFTQELSKLGSGVLNRISEVHYQREGEEELFLYMNDGIEVISQINGFSENMSSYPAIAKEIDPDTPGVLHMKMSTYFESYEEDTKDDTSEQNDQTNE